MTVPVLDLAAVDNLLGHNNRHLLSLGETLLEDADGAINGEGLAPDF